jgi:hypothetical protein
MPYKRIHSNGFEVMIEGDPRQRDRWLVRLAHGPNGEDSTLLTVKTSSLDMVKDLSDKVAEADHKCNDRCEDWKAVAA